MPGRNKKRVNYKRLGTKGRSPESDTVEVEIDLEDDSDIDISLAGRASSMDLNAAGPALDDSVTEEEIVDMRTQVQGQEQRLRQVLLRKELQQLRATFKKNEEALERAAAENISPAPRSLAPPVVRPRAPIAQQNSQPSTSRRRPNVRQNVPSIRQNAQTARTHQGEFDIDGYNADSESYIVNLVENDNIRNTDTDNIDSVNTNDYANSNTLNANGIVCGQSALSASGGGDVRSGMTARAIDRVKSSQHWAHAALPGDYNSEANTAFSDLDFRRLVSGEMEIILEFRLSQTELEGRLRLLRTLSVLLGSYPWTAVRSVYAAVLRRIELGRMTWSSDIGETMSFTLLTYAAKNPVGDSRPERQDRTNSGKRNVGPSHKSSTGEARVWYCPEYQRGTCAHNEPHQKEMYGKPVTVHHVCAKCLLRDRREAKHPDSSTACPHNRD